LALKSRSAAQRRPKGLKHRLAVANAIRNSRVAKLNPERVHEIRSTDVSAAELAQRFGVTPETINQVRAHKIWRDYSSPFAGLGARA
jgi:hypothetical protein